MSKVLIIGAGGVSGVVTHKCAGLPEVFSEIVLASRTEIRLTMSRWIVRSLNTAGSGHTRISSKKQA